MTDSAPKNPPRTIRILGVPMDLGQGRRGVVMGPSAVRYARLQDRLARLGYTIYDSGNVFVPAVEEISDQRVLPSKARHLDEIVRVCQSIYETVVSFAEADEFTI